MAKQKQTQTQQATYVRCSKCERSILKTAAVVINGKPYCCPDCAQGRTCDCQ